MWQHRRSQNKHSEAPKRLVQNTQNVALEVPTRQPNLDDRVHLPATDIKSKMTYTLRPYQAEAVEIAVKHLRKYAKPFVIQAATGAGKSLIIADICHKLNSPVLILQPSKELLEQNYEKLKSYGIEDVTIYSASMNTKEIGKYTYATIGSIYKKPELFAHFKYVIIDECHLVNPRGFGMYKTFLAAIGATNVCGLTATPYRIVQKYVTYERDVYYTASIRMINRIAPFFFKKIAYKIETQELIEQGYLSPIKYHVDEIKLDDLQVNSTGADFTPESLERFWNGRGGERMERLAKVIALVDEKNDSSLTFMSSVSAARRAQAMLDTMGIESHIVTGETPSAARTQLVEDYRNKKFKHMLNVGVFTTGFDIPHLGAVILARPTMSLALYYQMVGRGVRLDPANPDKILRVFDLAGTVSHMGRVETIKLTKEADGFRDMITSEAGRMDEVPLFSFKLTKKAKVV